VNGPELPRRTVLAAGLSVASAGAARRDVRQATIVTLVLRGGADGLSLLVPYQDRSYYQSRPTTAVALPPSAIVDLALDDELALHPGLAPLKRMFAEGELSVGVGIGAKAIDRSHTNAQSTLRRTLDSWCDGLAEGDAGSSTLVDRMRRLAATIQSRAQHDAHVVYCDGWDTHAAQGNGSSGRLATLVAHLGQAIGAFRSVLGKEIARVTLVVTSEFGRSLCETPMGGTDDGHAGICILLGGAIRGGLVLGRWSLEASALSQGRHLAPVMDLTSMLDQAARASR
jgi:uncharacterized protein (DUF1501 family)